MTRKQKQPTEAAGLIPEADTIGRRGFLKQTAKLLLGVGAACGLPGIAAAMQKAEKEDFDYQDAPNGDQSCANCVLYDGKGGCAIINGAVSADGWCTAWVD